MASSWQDDIPRVRQILQRLLRQLKGDQHDSVLDILDWLARVDVERPPSPELRPPAPQRKFHRNQPKTYRVLSRGGTEFLAEYREGGGQPFLCPHDVHDTFAGVLATSEDPQHFEILVQSVGERLGRLPSIYLLRICLRFWMTQRPPLVEKIRARYRALDAASFQDAARRAWDRAKRKK